MMSNMPLLAGQTVSVITSAPDTLKRQFSPHNATLMAAVVVDPPWTVKTDAVEDTTHSPL